MSYSNEKIEKIFSGDFETGKRLEDRIIIQPDGSRACAHWELVDNGFHLEELGEEKEMSDEELIKDAYHELEIYQKNKSEYVLK